jgi:cytochrome c biogenesis protein CcmG/thiol:disulfide interchange protein DsbE
MWPGVPGEHGLDDARDGEAPPTVHRPERHARRAGVPACPKHDCGGITSDEAPAEAKPLADQTAARLRPSRPLWFRALQLGALGLVAGLLALLGWRLVDKGRGASLVAAIADRKKPAAPGFELPVIWRHAETWPDTLRRSLEDGRVAIAELRGRPIVLNFWASWCIPCKHEAPLLAASARAHAGEVAFLGVDVQDFKSDARRFLRRYEANYVSVRDGGGSTYSGYGLTGVPETYYLDARGRIVAHTPGEVTQEKLETGIELALEGGDS